MAMQNSQHHAPRHRAQHGAMDHPSEHIKRRNPVGVWIGLPLITIGIYLLVWIYKIHDEMSRATPEREISPGSPMIAALIAPLTLFIWPIVATHKAGGHIAAAQRAAGQAPSCSGGMGVLLLFVFGLTPLYYQMELNKVAGDH